LQRELETTLGRRLLAGEIRDHTRVAVDVDHGELSFTTEPLPTAA